MIPTRLVVASALCAALSGACQSEGQLVLGLVTDLPARGEIDEVTLLVTRHADQKTLVQYSWNLSGIVAVDYRLPGSFNLYADGQQEPTFDVEIDGLLKGAQKVHRDASLGILADQELFVRLGLPASCEATGCPSSLTCVEGECVARYIDPHRLPKFAPAMVDHLDCASKATYIDTSSMAALPIAGACGATESCGEGTCLVLPSAVPGADAAPFVGGEGEVFADPSAPGAFFQVGPLDAPRYFATATPLPDGRVVIVGGFTTSSVDGSGAPVAGAVIYDPSRASFRRIADPPVAMGGHTATVLPDGSVLFVGTATDQAQAFTFDPGNELFAPLPAPMQSRQFHTATLLGTSGKVLLDGGLGHSGVVTTAELYDPTARTFSATTGPPLVSRAHHQATLLSDDRVLVTGGSIADGSFTASAEYFDPSTGVFTQAAAMTSARSFHTATVLADGNVLLVGGFAGAQGTATIAVNDDAELYVTSGTSLYTVGLPPFARAAQQAVSLPSGDVLFVGGTTTFGTTLTPAGGAYVYRSAMHTFDELPAPVASRIGAFAAALAGSATDDVLIGGGGEGTTTIDEDGGVHLDAGPDQSGDLATTPCEPVGTTSQCPSSSPVCTIAGASLFGPILSTIGPRCVPSGKGLQYGSACTPGDAAGTTADDCMQGNVCVTDTTDGMPRCQTVCHWDSDCTQKGVNRCALIVSGANPTRVGVCMPQCDFPDNPCTTTADMGISCHFEPNVAQSGAPEELQGVCHFDGSATVNMPCSDPTATDATQACSGGNYCVNGTCLIMCSGQANCTTCTMTTKQDKSGNGYCE